MKEMGSRLFRHFRRKEKETENERELRRKIESQREEIEGMVSEIFADPKVIEVRTASNYFPGWRDEMPNLHVRFSGLRDKDYVSCAISADYAEDSITASLDFDYLDFEFGSVITIVMDKARCTITEDIPDDSGNYSCRIDDEPISESIRLLILQEALFCFPKIKTAAGVEEEESERRRDNPLG